MQKICFKKINLSVLANSITAFNIGIMYLFKCFINANSYTITVHFFLNLNLQNFINLGPMINMPVWSKYRQIRYLVTIYIIKIPENRIIFLANYRDATQIWKKIKAKKLQNLSKNTPTSVKLTWSMWYRSVKFWDQKSPRVVRSKKANVVLCTIVFLSYHINFIKNRWKL